MTDGTPVGSGMSVLVLSSRCKGRKLDQGSSAWFETFMEKYIPAALWTTELAFSQEPYKTDRITRNLTTVLRELVSTQVEMHHLINVIILVAMWNAKDRLSLISHLSLKRVASEELNIWIFKLLTWKNRNALFSKDSRRTNSIPWFLG